MLICHTCISTIPDNLGFVTRKCNKSG